jgi:hypothetical protein
VGRDGEIVTGPREQGREKTAQGAGADHRDSHDTSLDRVFNGNVPR